jgi:hypothetical protein
VLKESDSYGLRGPPMASTLISYTESYDVDVEHAKMFSYKPSSRNLNDNPVLPVSPRIVQSYITLMSVTFATPCE